MKSGRINFVLYNIVVVFLLFGLLETGIEVLLRNPKLVPLVLMSSIKSYYIKHDRNIIQYSKHCAEYDSVLYYKLKAGNFKFSNREFETDYIVNSVGLRDDESALNEPEIIVLGDSYAMGWGVEQDETFANILEKKLKKSVLNAGISSYGTAREVLMLQRLNTDSLKYLIIQYCSNDQNENKDYLANKNTLKKSDALSYQTNCLNHERHSGYYLFKHSIKLVPIIAHRIRQKFFQKSKEVVAKESFEVDANSAFLNALESNLNLIPEQTKIIVFSISREREFIKGVANKLLTEPFSKLKGRIKLLDLSSNYVDSNCYVLDNHFNSSGHKLIADELENLLDSLESNLNP